MWNRLNKSMMFCQMMFGLSFYGVMVILTRFFLEDLNYSEADTMMVVGAFSSIGPLFAIAGGFIADKFLGAYRSLAISYVTFTIGYALLVLGASSTHVPLSLVGIALASYARGLMSPSYPSLYKRTFASEEDFNNGYPVNYSVNNVGALLGQYLFPMLVLLLGFHGSFALSALMATLATITLVVMRRPLIEVASEKDQQSVSMGNWMAFTLLSLAMVGLVFFMFSNMAIGQNIVYAIGLAAIVYFISLMLKARRAEALKMGTILIVTVLTTCFFVYYGQMMTSMAMNPLWCIVAGPAISYLFSTLEKRGITFSTATKIAFAFVLTAISFGILTFAVSTVGEDAIIRPEVFLVIHFFQAFAEVVVGSLVVAFILSVAPKQIENFSVSLFYIAMALSGIIGAVFSTSIALEKGQVVTQQIVQIIYGDYFKLLTVLAVVMVGVALLASVLIRKMLAAADASSPNIQDKQA
ncbi:TPA: MFS transporter [Vibrio cholerae]|nr:MFS transporter [Vibrio cholerae]